LLNHLKCKFKFDSEPLTTKKKSKHPQKRASSQVQSPLLANQGSPISQNTSRAKHTNQPKAQQDDLSRTSPQKEDQQSKNEDTISDKHDGDVAHGPLAKPPLLSPRVDILNNMKATLLAHGMLLQDENTRMIGTSLVKIEPLHYPDQQPEVFARRANLGVSHCLSLSWINECMRADTFAHQSELCPFCNDEFPANPSMKLISLRAMFKCHPKAVQQMEQSNPNALYLPVSFFWMCLFFSADCHPEPAVVISYTVFHNCQVLSVASC
jgi:hypothetical protein